MKKIKQLSLIRYSASLLLCLMAACSPSSAPVAENKDQPKPGQEGVKVFRLAKDSMEAQIQIPGELRAFQQVDLYAKVNSFVRKLYVDVGTEVKEGQLLASMEAPELLAQLDAANAKLKSQEAIHIATEATYQRLLATSKTPGTVAQNDLDNAYAKERSDKAQLDAARSAMQEVRDNRNYLEIRAPFKGVITARNVSAGAYVGPSGKGSDRPLFSLAQQDRLRLVASVPDQYAAYIDTHSVVQFSIHSLPGQKFSAKVARLAGALDDKLRAQRTEMDVYNEAKNLLPGMIAEIIFPLNTQMNAFVLPSSAVLNSTEGVFVIKVVADQSIWVPVKTGRSDDHKTEVFGDLAENDILVLQASEEIRNGAPIVQSH